MKVECQLQISRSIRFTDSDCLQAKKSAISFCEEYLTHSRTEQCQFVSVLVKWLQWHILYLNIKVELFPNSLYSWTSTIITKYHTYCCKTTSKSTCDCKAILSTCQHIYIYNSLSRLHRWKANDISKFQIRSWIQLLYRCVHVRQQFLPI